jgi:hypothetical protein
MDVGGRTCVFALQRGRHIGLPYMMTIRDYSRSRSNQSPIESLPGVEPLNF